MLVHKPRILRLRKELGTYLGARVEHAADIGANRVLHVVKSAVVPERVSGVAAKSSRGCGRRIAEESNGDDVDREEGERSHESAPSLHFSDLENAWAGT